MKSKWFKGIALVCLLIVSVVGTAMAFDEPNQNVIEEPPKLFQTTKEQLEHGKSLISKKFPDNAKDLKLFPSPEFILESADAKFAIDSEKNQLKGVYFTNVRPTGKETKISSQEAKQKASDFIKKHFTEIDLSRFQEEIVSNTNHIYRLNEVDRESGIKLLSSVTVVINQETGEIAMASVNMFTPPQSLKVSIDKETAQNIAEKAVKKEFSGAKLVRSSDTPEVKLDDSGKQRIGWIFIYESNKHSAGILVDGNTGDTIIQRAY